MEDWLGQSLVENFVQLHASIKHEKLIHIAAKANHVNYQVVQH